MEVKDLQTFEPILFLHEKRPAGAYPQIIMAGGKKQAIVWLPGNKVRKNPPKVTSDAVVYLGTTPGSFMSQEVTQHDQPAFVSWTGLDIDDVPVEEVIRTWKDIDPVSIRLSSSGNGVHLFMRYDAPILIDPGQARPHELLRTSWLPYMEQVGWDWERVCSSGYRAFYVSGGKCRWVKRTEEFIAPPTLTLQKTVMTMAPIEAQQAIEEKDERLCRLIKLLKPAITHMVPGKNPVYIKAAYEALKGSEFEFETKSPMQTREPHNNGFVLYEPGQRIMIFASADGRPVLTITAPAYWKAKLAGAEEAGRYRDSPGGQ